MGRRGKDEPPDVTANPALDQLERWTKACRMWNYCQECTYAHVCENVGDLLIGYLSHSSLTLRIRLIASSSVCVNPD